MIDHVHGTRMANRMATLNRRVTQCRQEMSLASTIAVLLWERDLPHLAALQLFHLNNR
jgi:hypothetical protein